MLMASTEYANLLAPLTVRLTSLKNRMVMTAHTTGYGWEDPRDDGTRHVAYLERRASGGVGLIINNPVHVVPARDVEAPYPLDFMSERFGRLAAACHRHGAAVVQQLGHLGAQGRSDWHEMAPGWSFGGTATPEGEATHMMTSREVQWVATGFARLAKLAVESGLDGVELHAAHGYLLQQSYSPWANQRDDEWGVPLRFLTTVIALTRTAIGPKALLGLRMCLDDFRSSADGGVSRDDLVAISATLAARGEIDYINHSQGSTRSHYARGVASWRHPPGEFLPVTAKLRAAVNPVPVIGVGRIVTPEQAEQALAQGTCDLVAMTRGHIADPDIVTKIQKGEGARVRRCVGANQGCVDRTLAGGLPITCLVNPEVGREHLLGDISPAESPRRVLVVGGGPAGLKAAEVAARRGHDVTLIEREGELGGRFRTAARFPPAAELASAITWLVREISRLGVVVHLENEATQSLIDEVDPASIVLATGATPDPARAFGDQTDDSLPLLSVDEGMGSALAGKEVLVLDMVGDHQAMFATEHLAGTGAKVTVLSPRPTVAAFTGATHIAETPDRLKAMGVRLRPNHRGLAVSDGRVRIEDMLTGAVCTERYDAVVAGVTPVPNLALVGACDALGVPVQVVGDAFAPRTALHAIRDGDTAGRSI
jgi:2,4-dienoyl-CoA reductase-like NADH-dependent reductase (Old Yellow Enzyme family)/thioredoxin reductase